MFFQLLLHSKWLNGSRWTGWNLAAKLIHISLVCMVAPLLLPLYILRYKTYSGKYNLGRLHCFQSLP